MRYYKSLQKLNRESDNILEMYGCEGLIPSKTATVSFANLVLLRCSGRTKNF